MLPPLVFPLPKSLISFRAPTYNTSGALIYIFAVVVLLLCYRHLFRFFQNLLSLAERPHIKHCLAPFIKTHSWALYTKGFSKKRNLILPNISGCIREPGLVTLRSATPHQPRRERSGDACRARRELTGKTHTARDARSPWLPGG